MKGFNWTCALLKKKLDNKETFKYTINVKNGNVISAKVESATIQAPKDAD